MQSTMCHEWLRRVHGGFLGIGQGDDVNSGQVGKPGRGGQNVGEDTDVARDRDQSPDGPRLGAGQESPAPTEIALIQRATKGLRPWGCGRSEVRCAALG